jgi:hypothetical protein
MNCRHGLGDRCVYCAYARGEFPNMLRAHELADARRTLEELRSAYLRLSEAKQGHFRAQFQDVVTQAK